MRSSHRRRRTIRCGNSKRKLLFHGNCPGKVLPIGLPACRNEHNGPQVHGRPDPPENVARRCDTDRHESDNLDHDGRCPIVRTRPACGLSDWPRRWRLTTCAANDRPPWQRNGLSGTSIQRKHPHWTPISRAPLSDTKAMPAIFGQLGERPDLSAVHPKRSCVVRRDIRTEGPTAMRVARFLRRVLCPLTIM